MKGLEKESGSIMNSSICQNWQGLAVYYEVCNILFPSLHYSGFPFNPVDKSLLSDILKILQDSLGIDDDNKDSLGIDDDNKHR